MVSEAVREFQNECSDIKRAMAVTDCMVGRYVKLSYKEDVDYLVEHLSKYENHNGVVVAGCKPWYVSVVRKIV